MSRPADREAVYKNFLARPEPPAPTIGTDGKARLWKVATQQETGTAVAVGPGASQGALAFSPDGKTFATVGANGTAALWSVATQRRTGALMTGGTPGSSDTPGAGDSPVAAVAFSLDGATLATTDASGSIRLWDAATQQEIGTPMTAGPGPLYSARSPGPRSMPGKLGADGPIPHPPAAV